MLPAQGLLGRTVPARILDGSDRPGGSNSQGLAHQHMMTHITGNGTGKEGQAMANWDNLLHFHQYFFCVILQVRKSGKFVLLKKNSD